MLESIGITRGLPELFTYVAFVLWVCSTALLCWLQLRRPLSLRGKLKSGSPRDILLIFVGAVWVSMWCFRTMY